MRKEITSKEVESVLNFLKTLSPAVDRVLHSFGFKNEKHFREVFGRYGIGLLEVFENELGVMKEDIITYGRDLYVIDQKGGVPLDAVRRLIAFQKIFEEYFPDEINRERISVDVGGLRNDPSESKRLYQSFNVLSGVVEITPTTFKVIGLRNFVFVAKESTLSDRIAFKLFKPAVEELRKKPKGEEFLNSFIGIELDWRKGNIPKFI